MAYQIPQFTMGQTALDFSPLQNALGQVVKSRQFDAKLAQDQSQFEAQNRIARSQLGIAQQAAARAKAEAARADEDRARVAQMLETGQFEGQGIPKPIADIARATRNPAVVQEYFMMRERERLAPKTQIIDIYDANGNPQKAAVDMRNPSQYTPIGGAKGGNAQRAAELGFAPGSPEYAMIMVNGKLPADYYEKEAQKRLRMQSAPKISEGLSNLARVADKYDDASFTNSVGPLQGSTPDGLIGSGIVNTARLGGEIWNKVQGGARSPTEVRADIAGSTEALAAAIKPLIRSPGEGAWTDADQARLVAVVGDLATASTKEEFRRRLNAVRDRIKSNFDLDINFDATPKNQGRLAPDATPRRARNAAGVELELRNGQWVRVN